jgi:hypothetical protein
MLGAAFIETNLFAAVNAALIALTLVLPALLVGYVRQATRRVSADSPFGAWRPSSSIGPKRNTARSASA